MTRSRKAVLIIMLVLAVVVMAGRMIRQDTAYLNAHVGEIQDCRPLTA